MAQLPTVGSSDWGSTLNDFLLVSHNTDGTINAAALPPSGTVTSVNGNTGAVDIEIGYAPVVAASNSASNITDSADYVCTGTADQTTINSAITAAATAGGGTIFLAAGTYNITAPISISASNITLEGTGVSTKLAVVAGSNLSSVISVTGTGTVEVKLRKFFIQGSISDTSGNGISLNTPWSSTDTQHTLEDIYINGCPGHGVQVPANADTRVLVVNRVHVKNCKGNGFYFPWPSETDSIFTDCIVDTIGLNGFYVGGLNNHFSNCKAFYCGNITGGGNYHGFYIVGYNNYFMNCEAQDNYQSGFYGEQPPGSSDPTYGAFGCTFVNCIADDNGQNGGTTYCKGFQVKGPQQWQIIGGVAMNRPYSSSWQKYGVSLEGGSANTTVANVLFYANATGTITDTSTGPTYTIGNNYSSAPSRLAGTLTLPAVAATGLTGATATSRYVGATASGAPASGTFAVGDFVIDQTAKVWICTAAGTPGTWTQVGSGGGSVALPLNLSSSAAAGDSFSITNTHSAPTAPTAQFIANASSDSTLGIEVSGDTNPRLNVDSNGTLNWGPGNAATDTNLFRSSGGLLATGSRFQISRSNTGGGLLIVNNAATPSSAPSVQFTAHASGDNTVGLNVSGDANYRFSADSTGKLQWGPGTAAADTNLYRSAANVLATDDALKANIFAPTGLTGATAASRYVGATASGAPASGTFSVGDFIIDQTGLVWICTTAGSPGTWTKASTALDTTAADIQPDGVQAAGSVGKAADAGHVHQNYADQSLYLTPTGCTGESVPRRYAAVGSGSLTSGTLFCAAIPLSSGIVVNKLTMVTYAAAATVTHGWYVLLDSSLVVRAVSADQTAGNWTTANTAVTLSFASAYTTTYSGLYYIGMCVSATTVPKMAASTALLNSTAGLSPILCGISSTAQTTPPTTGTTMASLTANGSYYFYGYTS